MKNQAIDVMNEAREAAFSRKIPSSLGEGIGLSAADTQTAFRIASDALLTAAYRATEATPAGADCAQMILSDHIAAVIEETQRYAREHREEVCPEMLALALRANQKYRHHPMREPAYNLGAIAYQDGQPLEDLHREVGPILFKAVSIPAPPTLEGVLEETLKGFVGHLFDACTLAPTSAVDGSDAIIDADADQAETEAEYRNRGGIPQPGDTFTGDSE